MKLDFNLPKPTELSKSDFYAVNLRQSGSCLKPVGCPPTLFPEAGYRNFRLHSGKILSIGEDRHDLFIDGESIGALSSPFGALLPDGPDDDCIILTTNSAPEWLVGGQLRGKFTPLKSEVSLSATAETLLEQSVEPLKLSGSYPRSSGTLTAPDTRKAADLLRNALSTLEERAAGAAMRVQPVWMAWQMLDSAGKVISRSEPQLIYSSAGFQGTDGVEMTLTRKDGKFTDCSSGSMQVKAYSVRLKIERAADSWRRSRAASLEVIASPPLEFITGATGAFNMVSSTLSTLYLSPLGADSASINALKTRSRAEFQSSARVIARVPLPLEGVDLTIGVNPLDSGEIWTETIAEPHAVCAFRGGSAVVYADASNPGMLLAAHASSPLAPVGSAKVATSRIHAICAPVGSSGGWNYGRYHLLAFAADGVYAVSIDRSLTSISSSLIHRGGVSSPSAVVAAIDAIYFATPGGSLLRLRGTALSSLHIPFPVASLAFVETTGELWMTASDSSATTATLNLASERICVRTDIHALRFDPESALAVDSAGALRDLRSETPKAVSVQWTRRIATDFSSSMVEWRIDSPLISGLELTLAVDGGGRLQRVNSMKLNGRLNAPLRFRVISPTRPYLSVIFNGTVDPSTRFSGIKF